MIGRAQYFVDFPVFIKRTRKFELASSDRNERKKYEDQCFSTTASCSIPFCIEPITNIHLVNFVSFFFNSVIVY